MRSPPNRLFRYRSLTDLGRIEHIFKKSELFFASPLDLNDPFDCRFRIEFNGTAKQRREFVARYVDTLERVTRKNRDDVIAHGMTGFYGDDHQYHQFIDEASFVKGLLGKLSVCCLTEKPDDILMWSHYANNHAGICLEFSPDRVPNLGILRRVTYRREIPLFNPLAPKAEFGFEVLFRKSLHWAYEAEWRSVVTRQKHQHAFRPEALTGVILGCEISSEHANKVMSWMRAREPVPRLYRARKKRNLYELDIVEEQLGVH